MTWKMREIIIKTLPQPVDNSEYWMDFRGICFPKTTWMACIAVFLAVVFVRWHRWFLASHADYRHKMCVYTHPSKLRPFSPNCAQSRDRLRREERTVNRRGKCVPPSSKARQPSSHRMSKYVLTFPSFHRPKFSFSHRTNPNCKSIHDRLHTNHRPSLVI